MLRERCFLTLLICIPALILAGFLKPKPVDPQIRSQVISKHFWIQKTFANGPFDMVLLGDSRVYRGVSPAAMEQILPNYRIHNLAYSNGSLTPLMFSEAERRLDPNSSKKSILLGVTPVSLTPIAAENEHILQEKGRPRDYVYMYRYFYRFMDLFQPVTPHMVLDSFAGQMGDPGQGYFQEFYDDGWVASWLVPEDPTKALESYRGFFSKTQVSAEIVSAVIEQTQKWTGLGMRVFAYRPPVTREMLELENEISGFNQSVFVERFQQAGGIWFDIPIEPYHSFDGSHLVKQSAIELSQELAARIRDTNLSKGDP